MNRHDPDAIIPRAGGTGGLGTQALRGVAVSGIAQGVKLSVQIVSVVLLSRFLAPHDFGLIAMASPVIAFANMAQNLGLSQAVMVNPTLTYAQASTMFWINAGLSLLLAIVLVACAPLVAAFYGERELRWIVAALAIAVFTSGLGAQHLALATRGMRFGAIAMVEMAMAVLGLTVALAWALVDPGPWALVASALVTALTSLIGAWIISGWRPRRPRSFATVNAMLRFGGGLTTFNLSNFFARNLDNILIGGYHGPVQLGLYDRAYKLLLFPLQQITYPLQRVMVPTLSQLVGDPDRYRSAYCRTVGQILLVTLPGILCLLVYANVAILFMLGPQWIGAVDVFRWLALASLHQPMTVTLGWLFISQSRTGQFARWGLFNAASCAAAFLVGLPWGAVGVAAAYALSDVFIRLPLVWRLAGSCGPVSSGDMVRLAMPFALAGSLTAAALFALRPLLPESAIGLITAVSCSYSVSLIGLAMTASGRKTIGQGAALIRSALLRRAG